MFRARDFRAMARDKLRGFWGRSLVATLLATLMVNLGNIIGGVIEGVRFGSMNLHIEMGPSAAMQAVNAANSNPLWALVTLMTGAIVILGHDLYYLRLCWGQNPPIRTVFSPPSLWLKSLGLLLYMTLLILLWMLPGIVVTAVLAAMFMASASVTAAVLVLLVSLFAMTIPALIASYRYAMAPFLLAQDPQMGVTESVRRSKAMMRGRKWRLFCLEMSFLGWILLCVFTLGLGLLWLQPYMLCARAAFYLDASGQGIPLNGAADFAPPEGFVPPPPPPGEGPQGPEGNE